MPLPSPLWVIAGSLSPYLFTRVLPPPVTVLLAITGILLLIQRKARKPALLLLAFAWTSWTLSQQLAAWLEAEQSRELTRIEGQVVSLPQRRGDVLEFDLDTAAIPGLLDKGGRLRVRWYRGAPQVRAGENWSLQARLRPPRARLNFTGADGEKHLFAQGISAVATANGDAGIRLSPGGPGLAAVRDAVRERLLQLAGHHPGYGLVLALAIADRGALAPEFRQAVAVTGTAHLLAISGLHVGLVAMFGYFIARALGMVLQARIHRCHSVFLAWGSGLLGAAAYSMLAGFGTSTRRALIMLGVLVLCVVLRRQVSPFRGWLLAMAAVLLLEPLSPLEAGFWLSFLAVAVLIMLFSPRKESAGRFRSLVSAQAAITLVMLPLGMQFFGQVGLGGLVANIAAIPWVSLLTLPLTLAGLLAMACSDRWAEFLLAMAAESGHWLETFIMAMAAWLDGLSWRVPAPGAALTILGVLGGCLLLMPRASRLWCLGSLLYLPALLSTAKPVDKGAVRLELLDVGQGLAVLLQTGGSVLLYDSGPGMPGQWDLYTGVIKPAVIGLGHRQPDLALISHGDLDHAGGLHTLENVLGRSALVASLAKGQGRFSRCLDSMSWSWEETRFKVLHPGPFLPYLGNDSSCVLAVRAPAWSLLLPGDIGEHVERRLAHNFEGRFDLLVAPHHGSRTSTSSEFLDWAQARAVGISAGAGNRFGFPHPAVVKRIRHSGAEAWSTSDCGGIRVEIDALGHMSASSARRERDAAWRWPAGLECP